MTNDQSHQKCQMTDDGSNVSNVIFLFFIFQKETSQQREGCWFSILTSTVQIAQKLVTPIDIIPHVSNVGE